MDNPQPTAWERWKLLAQRAATFQARVLLTLFYYTVVVPFGYGTRWLTDPLRLARSRGGRWTPTARTDPGSQH